MKKLTNTGLWGKIVMVSNLLIFVSFILAMVFLLKLDKVNVELTTLEPSYIEGTNRINEAKQPYHRIEVNQEYYSVKLDSLKALPAPKARKEATALKDEIKRVENELQSFAAEKMALDSSVASLQTEYDNLSAEYAALSKQVDKKKSVYDFFYYLTMILVVMKIACFSTWNYYNSKNLHLAAKWMKNGQHPRWTWLGWLVPVYNLVKPFSVFNEIWEETDYLLKDKSIIARNNESESDFVLELWWGSFLIALLVCLYLIHATFFTSGAMFWKFSHTAVAVFALVMWALYLLFETYIVKKYMQMNNILVENAEKFD